MTTFFFESSLVQIISELYRNPKQIKIVLVSSDSVGQCVEESLVSLSKGFLKETDIVLVPGFFQTGVFKYESSKKVIAKRLQIASSLGDHLPRVLICTISGFSRNFPSQDWIHENQFPIQKGDVIDIDQLTEKLARLVYTQTNRVEEVGEYAIRGAILDLWSPSEKYPLRIEFSDDQIDQIRLFHASDQRSFSSLESTKILSCREFSWPESAEMKQALEKFNRSILLQGVTGNNRSHLLEDLQACVPFAGIDDLWPLFSKKVFSSFFDQVQSIIKECDKDFSVCFIENQEDLKKSISEIDRIYGVTSSIKDHNELLAKKDFVFPGLASAQNAIKEENKIESVFDVPPSIQNELAPLEKLKFPQRAQKLKQLLDEKNIDHLIFSSPTKDSFFEFSGMLAKYMPEVIDPVSHEAHWTEGTAQLWMLEKNLHPISFCSFQMSQGFYLPDSKALVVAESWVRNTAAATRFERFESTEEIYTEDLRRSGTEAFLSAQFSEFVQGDLVVHVQHGIARFLGLMTLKVENISSDFLTLEYAGGDKIYVPVNKLNLVQKYVGASESTVLDSLKGSSWEKRKEKVQKDVEKIAKELMEYQAKRSMTPGHAFSRIDEDYLVFEDAFPFDETPDQLKAIQDIMMDMSKPKSMDRLLCGDVGFGKTEVAMRAAYRCVLDGKQVAWLVPTTVLAHQHFRSLKERFLDFGVQVEMLDRSVGTGSKVLDKLKKGEIDILIGTHRILSKDMAFRDLGLLIVDEEQRFGVMQKEKIKAMSFGVDVLTLTATPIPRTLQMAMSGLRDLSLLTTPPKARLATKTFVCPFEDDIIRNAIQQEIARGGQIFYVHNRVFELESVQIYLKDLIPQARIGIAHGKMTQKDLESKIISFLNGEFDILLCTTIIESGIDMPNVNTIIVQNADHFGLAQLYQLRGRVGRRSTRGYAYFLTSENLKEDAEGMRRLEILQDHQELGSGFVIASHDLEMRGCGNILGDDQSGKVADVGLETYLQMLDDAIKHLGGKKVNPTREVEIQIPITIQIPDHYIENAKERLKTYRRFFGTQTEKALANLAAECEDRFGSMPVEVKNLMEVSRIRRLLVLLGAVSLTVSEDVTEIRLDQRLLQPNGYDEDSENTFKRILDVCNHRVKNMRLTPDGRVLFPLKKKNFLQDDISALSELKRVLSLLAGEFGSSA